MPSELVQRIDASIADLDRASAALGSQALGDILEPVRDAFADRIGGLRERLLEDRKDAQMGPQDWRVFESHRRDAAALLLECLAFVQGVLLRRNGFDNGWCSITDKLLAELSDSTQLMWSSFSLPADGESFASLANVVRLRFPSNGIWDLPIAAHEFGHFAATRLKAALPKKGFTFDDLVDGLKQDAEEQKRPWGKRQVVDVNEFFADAFATFVLGPAYARSCLYCRFSPGAADQASEDHPSYACRAKVVLEVLERMEKDEPGFGAPRAISQTFWSEALRDAGKEASSDPQLRALARDIFQFLSDAVPRARYGGWKQAQVLSASMSAAEVPGFIVGRGTSVADVINAAWMARMSGQPADQVSDKALAICNHLVQQPA